MSVLPKMLELRDVFQSKGIEVETPTLEEPTDYSVMPETERAAHKEVMIRNHLERIRKSDAILVVNEDAKGVEGYIGANSFLEMGFAFAFDKPIYLLNAIPNQPNKDELFGLHPTELHGDISILLDTMTNFFENEKHT